MKKLLFALANVLLVVRLFAGSSKPGPTGFDVLRDSIANGKIDTITYYGAFRILDGAGAPATG